MRERERERECVRERERESVREKGVRRGGERRRGGGEEGAILSRKGIDGLGPVGTRDEGMETRTNGPMDTMERGSGATKRITPNSPPVSPSAYPGACLRSTRGT